MSIFTIFQKEREISVSKRENAKEQQGDLLLYVYGGEKAWEQP